MMSKKSMVLTTTILTMITLLFVYIDYTQGRLFNITLFVLCVFNVILIISVVILLFEDTKIERWVYKKWDKIEYETQRDIRACAVVLFLLAAFIVICFVLSLIPLES